MIAYAIFVVCRRAAPAVIRLRFQPSFALCLRTSGLNQCCMILYLHCLVFREHRAALSSQLLYLTSSSGSCQELFSEVFRSPGAPSAPWRLSPAGLASPVCRRLFADDLYYITRFFRACQYVFAKNMQNAVKMLLPLCCLLLLQKTSNFFIQLFKRNIFPTYS